MAIVIPHPLTVPEIRVLQEYRRVGTETLTLTAINAIKHPTGGGDAPARSLAAKGYLSAADGDAFTLTEPAKAFLAIDVRPEGEGTEGGAEADA